MPIWLRKFTFETLKEHFEKKEAAKNGDDLTNTTKHKEVPRANIARTPTYISKVAKK
jgi:hypothetical protein